MDKSCRSTADTTSTDTNTNNNTTDSSSNTNLSGNMRDDYLKHINRLSHKITKPTIKKPNLDAIQTQQQSFHHSQPQLPPSQAQSQAQNLQQQPPVYNINKNDFRDVVQRLTGSPAHERSSNPSSIQQPKPQSSRLQRIRPPPLSQISNRPSPLLKTSTIPLPQPPAISADNLFPNHPTKAPAVNSFSSFARPVGPLSPLPPFPTVHVAVESPVSAYMRYLHSSTGNFDSNPKQISGFSPLAPLVSPRRNNLSQTQSHPEPQSQIQHQFPPVQQGTVPSSTTSATTVQPQPQFQLPPSPFPFGCLNSPNFPYSLLSPSLFLSPTSGQLGFSQLPLSPTVPVPSPKWSGH